MAEPQEGYTYKIVNIKSATVLDLSGTDGESIIGWEWHGGDNQKWRLERNGNQWLIQNVGTGKYLGYPGFANDLGDNSILLGVNNPQEWDIWRDEVISGAYRIFAHGTSLNVDLTDYGNPANGTPVALWGRTQENINQTWRFEEV